MSTAPARCRPVRSPRGGDRDPGPAARRRRHHGDVRVRRRGRARRGRRARRRARALRRRLRHRARRRHPARPDHRGHAARRVPLDDLPRHGVRRGGRRDGPPPDDRGPCRLGDRRARRGGPGAVQRRRRGQGARLRPQAAERRAAGRGRRRRRRRAPRDPARRDPGRAAGRRLRHGGAARRGGDGASPRSPASTRARAMAAGALACFTLRMLAVWFDWNLPRWPSVA